METTGGIVTRRIRTPHMDMTGDTIEARELVFATFDDHGRIFQRAIEIKTTIRDIDGNLRVEHEDYPQNT